MTRDEIIFYEVNNKNKIKKIVDKSVIYAILSLPFTVNRMEIKDVAKRLLNIIKGKIAENVFFDFCDEKGINIDKDSCLTPFYQIDKRDFLFGEYECDIKNNYIWETEDLDYIKLPALVPNRHSFDQWSKRNKSFFGKKVIFLFTFIKQGELRNGMLNYTFLEIKLDEHQKELLRKKCNIYQGKPQNGFSFNFGFDEDEYFRIFLKTDQTKNIEKIVTKYLETIKLIITGYATQRKFYLFRDVNGKGTSAYYMNYPWPNWYEQTDKGANFLNGVIITKIKNATCPIVLLPSIKSLFGL